MINNKTCNKS